MWCVMEWLLCVCVCVLQHGRHVCNGCDLSVGVVVCNACAGAW